MEITRRDSLGALALGGAALFLDSARAQAQAQAAPTYEPKPLPFDPSKLNGISEKMIRAHHEKNYTGAVKSLNRVEQELAALTKDTPPFVISGIKRNELMYSNSMIYHEHYFANLGGGGKLGGGIEKAIAEAFGSSAAWEAQFRQTGMALGGGSGWATLEFNLHTGKLRNYWSDHHTLALASGAPLLVMDMYEHAYQQDYGPDHAKYIDAFFTNVNWDVVEQRLERAKKIHAMA